jgi:hypothetical protein
VYAPPPVSYCRSIVLILAAQLAEELVRVLLADEAEQGRPPPQAAGTDTCLPLRWREIIMNMATGFDRRHPRGVILTRVLVTAWLLALTGILLAYGYWGWALVTLAGAVANLVWAYRVYRAAMH